MSDDADDDEFRRELRKTSFFVENKKQVVQVVGVLGLALGSALDGVRGALSLALLCAGVTWLVLSRLPD